MSYIGTGLMVAGTVANVASQRKAAKDAKALQQDAMKAAGTRPEIAAYEEVPLEPVDFQGVQRDTLQGNYNMLDLIQQLMQRNSQINQSTSRARANGISPDLWTNTGATAAVAKDYLNGKASWSDSMETVARSTGLTGSAGTPGTGAALTARDLGLMDMDLRERGANLNAQAIAQGEALDPRGNYGTPQDWQVTPREAIPWKVNENLSLSKLAMDQAENVYTAEQNGYNIAAGVDPARVAGMAFGREANRGVDWGNIIKDLGGTYAGVQSKRGLDTGGSYGSARAATRAAPYAGSYSRTASGGYVPRAQVVA